MKPATYAAEVAAFVSGDSPTGWSQLPRFRSGEVAGLAARLDQRVTAGTDVLPPAGHLLTALRLTPPANVRVVILGQDPYPTPGHAHGLAFSVLRGVRVPRSLANIFKERESDLGIPPAAHGDLSAWADQGVLLLNACLSVKTGQAGAHRKLGWEALTRDVIKTAEKQGAVFILWGADAEKLAGSIDLSRNHVIASAHPSPLSARRGFFGSGPFSRANAWLEAQGKAAIDWRT
jgi:uracil-DNA glycosylase